MNYLYAISRQAAMTIIPRIPKKDRADLRIFSQYIYQKKDILARVFSYLLFLSFSDSPLVRRVVSLSLTIVFILLKSLSQARDQKPENNDGNSDGQEVVRAYSP
jgi:hypothetical protein